MSKQVEKEDDTEQNNALRLNEALAAREDVEQANNEEKEYLTFKLGKEEYGVDIMSVQEIKAWEETRKLPNSPETMCGVIDLRGVMVPIVDLRAKFHMDTIEYNNKNVFIIMDVHGKITGILVDMVSDIIKIKADELKPAPEMEKNIGKEMLSGLISRNDRMVVILNMEHLIDERETRVDESAGEPGQSST